MNTRDYLSLYMYYHIQIIMPPYYRLKVVLDFWLLVDISFFSYQVFSVFLPVWYFCFFLDATAFFPSYKRQMQRDLQMERQFGYGLWCLMPLSTIAISWQSVLLVEKNEVPGENHWPVAGHWQTQYLIR